MVGLVIIGCCVGIVLCCRRQTNPGRVVRVPAAATTIHQTHTGKAYYETYLSLEFSPNPELFTVVQPQPYQPYQPGYQPGQQPSYPVAHNKDQPPSYSPPAYTTAATAYPPMPQPAMNPAGGAPYPTGAPPYPMAAPVQQQQLQASAPMM